MAAFACAKLTRCARTSAAVGARVSRSNFVTESGVAIVRFDM